MFKHKQVSIFFSRGATLLGLIFLILAIFFCRFDIIYKEIILARIPNYASSWILKKTSWLLSHDCLKYWLASTPVGVIFFGLGSILLWISKLPQTAPYPPLAPDVPQKSPPQLSETPTIDAELTPTPSTADFSALTGPLWGLSLFSLIASYLLEQSHLLNAPATVIGWLIILVLPLVYTFRADHSDKISLRPHLSFTELFFLISGSLALIIFYQRGVDSWRYAFIGDEYGFLQFAISLINKPLSEASPLEASGYAEFFPMLLSWWQAIFLFVFGEHNAAWRLSVAVITASSLIPFYILLKLLLVKLSPHQQFKESGSKLSFIAVSLVAITSLFLTEFTVIWAKIGKPHAVFLPPAIFATAALSLGLTKGSRLYLLLAGFFAGFGTYLSSLSPILAIAACGALLVSLEFKTQSGEIVPSLKRILGTSLILIAGFLIVAAPLMVQFDFWQNMFEVNLTSVEAERNSNMFCAKLLSAVMLPLEFRTGTHFMFGNPVDIVLAFLILVGLASYKVVGWRAFIFSILLHLEFSLLAGGLSKYHYPPETRMMVAMFPLALLACFGFSYLCELVSRSPDRPFTRLIRLSLSIFICLWISIYHWIKLEEYNPHSHQLDSSIAILKKIQQFDDQRRCYWFFASPIINRQPLQIFSEFFVPTFTIRSFSNDRDGLFRMRQLLNGDLKDPKSRDRPSAIIIEDKESLREEITILAQMHGIPIVSFDAWNTAERREDLANPLSNQVFPLIKILEGRGTQAIR